MSGDLRGLKAAAEPMPVERPLVAIVGAGRAGSALALGLHRAGYRFTAVHSLSPTSAAQLAGRVGAEPVPTALAAVLRADLTLLTVPDRAITRLAATVAAAGAGLRGRGLVHCSGAQDREALAAARSSGAAVACCHPLMAIARGADPDELRGAYFGIDADAELLAVLERMVRDLGGVPFRAPGGDRALYHAAAVLVGNAPLALLARAGELLAAAGVAPEVAGPALAGLLAGAARNARRLGPREALTGPVVRNDPQTVRRHLEALRGDPQAQRLYHRLARETLRATGATGREEVAELLSAPAKPARTATVRTAPATGPVAPAAARLRPARGSS